MAKDKDKEQPDINIRLPEFDRVSELPVYDREHPWKNILEAEPEVIGDPDGSNVYDVCVYHQKRRVLPRLVRASSEREAREIYCGDGVKQLGNEILVNDVTATYQESAKLAKLQQAKDDKKKKSFEE